MSITLRFMQKSDLPHVLGIEHYQPSPWKKSTYLRTIRQRHDESKGTFDTRALVAETTSGPGIPEVVGAMLYELADDGYRILRLVAVEELGTEVLDAFVGRLLARAERSATRKIVSMVVKDGDYSLLKFFQENGFSVTSLPDHFDGVDGWLCQLSASA